MSCYTVPTEPTIFVSAIDGSLYVQDEISLARGCYNGYAARYKFDGLVKVTAVKLEDVGGEKTDV